MIALTPESLLRAYAVGLFPMAEGRHDPKLYWIDPDTRGVIPLDGFHVPKRLARTVRQDRFEVTVNSAFGDVIRACAAPGHGRDATWINSQIIVLFEALHRMGNAHSIECRLDGRVVGGLYGVSIGGAFFGESMFSDATDSSKVALVHLVARLSRGGYRLLDTQFLTEHLKRFGAVEVSRATYRRMLTEALAVDADFYSLAGAPTGREILQSITQTS